MNVFRGVKCLAAALGALIASNAMAVTGYTVSLVTTNDCSTNGHVVVAVKLGVTGGPSTVAGGQIFLNYGPFLSANNASITVGPGLQGVLNTAGGGAAVIAVGVTTPGGTIADNATLATIDFTYTGTSCPSAGSLVTFDTLHAPASALTDNAAQSLPFTPSNLASVTLGDSAAPVITCPSSVSVSWDAGKDPWATGFATALDTCDPSPVISFTDDRSGLTSCGGIGGRGTLVRTWKATDHCGNFSTCSQTITVTDTTPAVVTGCPADIQTNADAGSCSAVVAYSGPTAYDQQHLQGFEAAGYVVAEYDPGQSTDWNQGNTAILTRVASGTLGVSSASGGFHGDIATSPRPSNDGPFTRLGGYSTAFGTGFVTSLDMYIDLADPAIAQNRYTIELTSAASRQNGDHLQDFVFHIQNSTTQPGQIWIAGDNNAYLTRRGDFDSAYNANHAAITTTGWYTLRWTFRDNGSGFLACDMQALTSGGAVLFTETRTNLTADIATTVGGNRYMWFTYIDVSHLAIDNAAVRRPLAVSCVPPSGSSFASGTTPVTCSATDACGNTGSCGFNVVVNPYNTLNATIALSGVSAGPFTRGITFSLYTAAGCAGPTFTAPCQDIVFSGGTGTATFDVPCGTTWTGITATDTKHTLRRTTTVGTSGVVHTADFTGAKSLQGGNINNDGYIDILDFGGYIGQFGANYGTADTLCGAPGLNADFSGNGNVGTEDFSFIQSGFLAFRDVDPCGGTLINEAPITDIAVSDLVTAGLRTYAMADFNLDGRLNAGDIAHVAQHGLPLCAADFNDDQATNVQDIFTFLNAWFADHPKADINNNTRTDVQDIFQFLDVWFQGC